MPRPQRRAKTNEKTPDILARISEIYYTPQEAMRILGMNRDTFNNYVRKGVLHRVVPLGTHGYFSKAEIDAMAERLEALFLTANNPVLEFRAANVEDLEKEDRLAYLNFGPRARSPERVAARRRFLVYNPYSSFHLYNHGNLVASINITPLKHEAILEFRDGKRGWQFPNEMIEQFEPGHPLELIIIDMMTTTNAPPSQRQYYAQHLLHRISDVLAEWGKKGIIIKSIDACGGTEAGRRILKSAGFDFLGEKNGRDIFTLDVENSDLKLLKKYKNALRQQEKST